MIKVSFDAGLSSGYEDCMPTGQSSQCHGNSAGQHPHIDDALINHLILKGVRRCSCLIVGLARWEEPYENSHPCHWYPRLFHIRMFKALNSIVCIQEEVSATDATKNTAHGHEEAEVEEVTVV